MGASSNKSKHKAKLKRTVTVLSRQLRQAQQMHYQSHLMLLTVLAQKGGEVVVTMGTMQQAQENIATLGWSILPYKPIEGQPVTDWVVKLVTAEAPSGVPEVDNLLQVGDASKSDVLSPATAVEGEGE